MATSNSEHLARTDFEGRKEHSTVAVKLAHDTRSLKTRPLQDQREDHGKASSSSNDYSALEALLGPQESNSVTSTAGRARKGQPRTAAASNRLHEKGGGKLFKNQENETLGPPSLSTSVEKEGVTITYATEECNRLLLTSTKPNTHLQKDRCLAACRTWTLLHDDRPTYIETVKLLLSRLCEKELLRKVTSLAKPQKLVPEAFVMQSVLDFLPESITHGATSRDKKEIYAGFMFFYRVSAYPWVLEGLQTAYKESEADASWAVHGRKFLNQKPHSATLPAKLIEELGLKTPLRGRLMRQEPREYQKDLTHLVPRVFDDQDLLDDLGLDLPSQHLDAATLAGLFPDAIVNRAAESPAPPAFTDEQTALFNNSVLWDPACSPAFSTFASGFTSQTISPPYASPTVDDLCEVWAKEEGARPVPGADDLDELDDLPGFGAELARLLQLEIMDDLAKQPTNEKEAPEEAPAAADSTAAALDVAEASSAANLADEIDELLAAPSSP